MRLVPWEVFGKPLAKALKRSDGVKGDRPVVQRLFLQAGDPQKPRIDR